MLPRTLVLLSFLPSLFGIQQISQCDGDDDGSPTPHPSPTPSLSCQIFPEDNPWNVDISAYPVHENSDAYIQSIGADDHLHPDFGTTYQGQPIGIPYVYVTSGQEYVPVTFVYASESDSGPYPIPSDAPIEGGENSNDDRHVLVLEQDGCLLYELWKAYPVNGGESWTAGSGAIFDLSSNELRPECWTSADAAGLPIYPGLVKYEEVVLEGVIDHALRFTVSESQRGYIHPATHYASDETAAELPPMGLRLRLKSSYDCSGYSSEVQVICAALKRYGMLVADNGSNWYITGSHDDRWDDESLSDLKQIPGSAFEAIDTGEIITDCL